MRSTLAETRLRPVHWNDGVRLPKIEVQHLFIGYVALIILGLAFFFWRKPRRGMLLRMKGRTSPINELFGAPGSPATVGSHIDRGARDLNVVFNYNGHSWDAFEVLGIPAGSPIDRVRSAHLEACQKVDADSRPFLDAALNAIAHHTQN